MKLQCPTFLGGDAFTRKYIISLLTLALGQGQTRNAAQYHLHHITYASAKFEAAMANGLGGNALFDIDLRVGVTQNVSHCPLHHVTYAPTEFEVTTSKALGGEAFNKKIQYLTFDLDLGGQGHRTCCPIPSTSCDLSSYKV